MVGDRRPYTPLKIFWRKGQVQRVLALIDTGAEVTLIHGNTDNFEGECVTVTGYGGSEILAKIVQLRLAIGNSTSFKAPVLISAVEEYVLGIDIIRGQYRLPGGHKEIGETIQELLKVGIIRPAISPFNSPVWPVKKKDGSWHMTVDYHALNAKAPPLTAAVPDIVTITEQIMETAGDWHVVIDLANAFFSIPIAAESQDQFAFTWQDRQYTFQVLPQGYLHRPTLCHGLVARDLANCKTLERITYFHCVDDILLAGDNEEKLAEVLDELIKYMHSRGWAINDDKMQGPAREVNFLGAMWLGPERKIPQKVIESILKVPVPVNKGEAQSFVGLLGYWRNFIPHLGLILRPIHDIVKKKAIFKWGESQQIAFDKAKEAIQEYQGLGPVQAGVPFELEASEQGNVATWSLWLKRQGKRVPVGFWSRQMTGSQQRYSQLEKQLLAAYWALLHTQRITKDAQVTLRTGLPIQVWVRDDTQGGRTGAAQNQTLCKWKWYLQPRAKLEGKEPSALHGAMAGTVQFEDPVDLPQIPPLEPSPFCEAPAFSDLSVEQKANSWFTDGAAQLHKGIRKWKAVAYHPVSNNQHVEEGDGKSSQWAELRAVAKVLERQTERPIVIYTDSWAVFQDFVTWAPKWREDRWHIRGKPVWGGEELWESLWENGQRGGVLIGHVSAHIKKGKEKQEFNNKADAIASDIRAVSTEDRELMQALAAWGHQTSGHLGIKASVEWCRNRSAPVTENQMKQAIEQCETCAKVRQWPLQKISGGSLHRGEKACAVWQNDYVGPLRSVQNKRYLMTAVDTYTGIMQAYPVQRATQANTIKSLSCLVQVYGISDEIQSDNGTHFTGAEVG
ncbi:LOW QUALITY PROTEIN: uncharacterized protein LOC120534898 [Polypterus senegalus]|uniref:LOW QUALITY PROTEIN: uncharacterized protein LOC120534898 n=1 Tax=Polypterus senegalus TaxID=55291 RepID=UPI0019641802|nr:LOW QUALITY PROTEIN: uncharacterized protein LOC120534898 [Polypterus senegalus]